VPDRPAPAAPPSIFFVHVMKTAGTAFLRLTGDRYAPERTSPRAGLDVSTLEQKQSIDYLLDHAEALRRDYELISAHVPAWVATAVAPDHLRVTLLRDPVDRTISQLRQSARIIGRESLEELFDNDHWRNRLSNYMTRVFGLRAEEHLETRAGQPQGLGVNDLPEAERAEFVDEIKAAMDLSMNNVRPMTGEDLRRAVETLESCELVGTMDRFDDFLRQASDLIGVPVPPARQINEATDDLQVSPALRRRIEAELALDIELYETVCSRRLG
jgi:hypothetical protein